MSKKKTSSRLRKYRQRIDLSQAVVVGRKSLGSICYAYRFPSRPDRIKIGYSSRGVERVAEQSTAFPEKPEVIFIIHDKRAEEIEAAFHKALASYQSDVLGTEWFDVSFQDLLAVSPALRRAVGAGRVQRFFKWIFSAIFFFLGLLALPAIAAVITAIAEGQGVPDAVAVSKYYLNAVADRSYEPAVASGKWLLSTSWKRDVPIIFPILSVVPALLMGVAPWIRLRRQAF
jgi:hypothetical protein